MLRKTYSVVRAGAYPIPSMLPISMSEMYSNSNFFALLMLVKCTKSSFSFRLRLCNAGSSQISCGIVPLREFLFRWFGGSESGANEQVNA